MTNKKESRVQIGDIIKVTWPHVSPTHAIVKEWCGRDNKQNQKRYFKVIYLQDCIADNGHTKYTKEELSRDYSLDIKEEGTYWINLSREEKD